MEKVFDGKALTGKSIADVFKELHASEKGLSGAEAARRLKEYGLNEFSEKKRLRPFLMFASKFRNPLLILLLAAALISGALGSHFEAGIIVMIVFGSALIDFINTYKSAKAAEALQEKVMITAAVLRNGTLEERNVREIVPGDVFSLEAGDLMPADGVVFEAKDLFVDEGVLTGESVPIEKTIEGDSRLVSMGTSVVSGKGFAVAIATGAQTKIGDIANQLKRPEVQTEFEKNLKEFSGFIFRVTLFLVLAVILLNIFFNHQDPLQMFLFAVAIAVGLTPELLPLIVTSNLAKGALIMSKDGVIVKKLAAIHNFGSIDVICTDKTGTLTEDRIELIRSIGPLGEDNDEVFLWGYISSKHLTGVRGVLDAAIENYGAHLKNSSSGSPDSVRLQTENSSSKDPSNIPSSEVLGFRSNISQDIQTPIFEMGSQKLDVSAWEKIDEIPFDAVRRVESVVVHNGKETVLITKGAPEELFMIAETYGSKSEKLTSAVREKITTEYASLSSAGFRVLGVGIRNVPLKKEPYGKADENNVNFVGFLAFLDPPKKTVKATLEKMEKINVSIKIITGDNFLVTKHIAEEIGLVIGGALTGDEIAKLDEHELEKKVEQATIFSRVTPEQKELIIRALRKNGHVVGYMGDGVNDVLALKEADVSISVNNAVDIAKETADIILLRKGLREVTLGIIEGRRTFANTFKYLQMALSSNFGNMFSMPVASLFLPFLPMTAPQILLNNFLYDSSQLAIPFDNVEEEFLARPKKFDIGFLKRFMIVFGPLSSCFDFITFGVLFFVFRATGSSFQTGWFLESIATQTLVVNIIRSRSSIWKSTRPSTILLAGTFGATIIAWYLPYSFLAPALHLTPFNLSSLAVIIAIVVVYLFAVESIKNVFYKRYGGLIEK